MFSELSGMDRNQILELIQIKGFLLKSSMHKKLNFVNSSFAVSLYPRGKRTLNRCLVQRGSFSCSATRPIYLPYIHT